MMSGSVACADIRGMSDTNDCRPCCAPGSGHTLAARVCFKVLTRVNAQRWRVEESRSDGGLCSPCPIGRR